jgi:nicotinate phosphoribosyltransferase
VPIDGYGIGTNLTTSQDAPALDCAYKLQEYDGRPKRKRSEGKATWPGRKQVFRQIGGDGRMTRDVLTLETDPQEGERLIHPVLRDGKRVPDPPTLDDARKLAAFGLARLPTHLRELRTEPAFPVAIAASLQQPTEDLDRAQDARRDDIEGEATGDAEG